MNAAEYAQGLRYFADWVEANPELAERLEPLVAYAYPAESEIADWARAMKPAEKKYADTLFHLKRGFGGVVTLDAVFWRVTVCRKVVTGTRHVPEKVIPSYVIEAHEEEIVEWECDEPILAGHSIRASLLEANGSGAN